MRPVPFALFIPPALVVTLIGSDRSGGQDISVREAGGLTVGRYPGSNERRWLSQINVMTNRCPQKVDPFAISI